MVQVAKCLMLSVRNTFLHIIPARERTTVLQPLW